MCGYMNKKPQAILKGWANLVVKLSLNQIANKKKIIIARKTDEKKKRN